MRSSKVILLFKSAPEMKRALLSDLLAKAMVSGELNVFQIRDSIYVYRHDLESWLDRLMKDANDPETN